ncbi:MAG: DNA-processing protein DprA, partial [Clostridia bacterium]|nr:DNA-processing protein DprA [Clostridia bacterium]
MEAWTVNIGIINKEVFKIEIIDYNSEKYPILLKNIDNPPQRLYAEGNLELLNSNAISVIGSRACSVDGIKYAKQFSKELASMGITIISGMAVGIDTSAHVGCLEVGGNTIAVLGCGLNNIFPKQNIKLYHRILENNGLVISEYPPDAAANSARFLERNRIVSGLSIGVLVIEAAHRSGTSVTASLAQKQHKSIFCLPHDLKDKHGVGTNRLIKNGASLVTCTNDIIKKFDFLHNSKIKIKNDDIEQLKIIELHKYIDVYNLLVGPPQNVDELCEKINKPVQYINNALFALELDGLI